MSPLRIAARVPATEVEGPGLRFAVWVQGCTLACPGCCNPEMFAPRGGERIALETLAAEIEAARTTHGIEGLTVLGGEPLQQLGPVAELCRRVAARGLGVVVFTGYTLTEARALPGFSRLWAGVDTLVTGRYDRTRPEPADGRRAIGSANQRLEHRTSRYRSAAAWSGPPRAEIHVAADGRLQVLGSPPAVARIMESLTKSPRAPV